MFAFRMSRIGNRSTAAMNISRLSTVAEFIPGGILPDDGRQGHWVGRAWIPAHLAENGIAGPRVIGVFSGRVHNLSGLYPTFTDLLNAEDAAGAIRDRLSRFPELLPPDKLIAQSLFTGRSLYQEEEREVVLLAPNDLSATRACGVTFIRSLLERVIEEKAGGDPQRASSLRTIILDTLGEDLSRVKAGSPETATLKRRLMEEGVWSQYLEVGIGPDAEIFTKAQPMASVGFGAQIGVLPGSKWNNPEPEVVLAVNCRGEIVGATLGNDVNLRDYEGRSALLLGEAKDQNGSCAIGPLVRLFDDSFTLEDVRHCEVELTITGEDGFTVSGRNRMSEISRSPEELTRQAIGEHHQYPDGLMLFLGTMFAPTDDRDNKGEGFTHHPGDRVEISTEPLGKLVNWVNATNAIPPWTYGSRKLLDYLTRSALIKGKEG